MTVYPTYMRPGVQAALIEQGRAARLARKRVLRDLQAVVRPVDAETAKLLDDAEKRHHTRRFTGNTITGWGDL